MLVVTIMAACSSGTQGGGPAGPAATAAVGAPTASLVEVVGSITMWIPPIAGDKEAPYWPDRIAAFKKEYPKVDVAVEVIPFAQRDERLNTAIAGSRTPDVVYALPRDVPRLAELGVLADLSGLVRSPGADFYPNAVDAMIWKGKAYGIPVLMNVTTTIYNKAIFERLGITKYPETWDEVRALAPAISKAGYYVTQYEGALTMTLNGSFYPLLWMAGGDILSPDQTKATFNGPEGLRALEFLRFLVDNGYTPKDALTTQLPVEASPLGRGEVAMVFSRSTASLQQNNWAKENMVIAPPLRDKASKSYGTVAGFVRFAASKSPTAADAWIKWITSAEELKRFLPMRGVLSPRASVKGLYDADPLMKPQEALMDRMTIGIENHPRATEIMKAITPHLQAALLGKATSQAALNAAAADVNAILARR